MTTAKTDLQILEKHITQLEDRIAIEELQGSYWDYLDSKQWELLETCFTDDFVFENMTTGGLYKGREQMINTMKNKFKDGVISSHHGHHHTITFNDTHHATGHWALEDDLYDSIHGGEFKGRGYYDISYCKDSNNVWHIQAMKLSYLRGEGSIKKCLDDTAEAYKTFLM